LAEGAVRLPSGRLIPKAAQRRLESCRGESSLESKALAVDRFASASIRGMPPVFCGAGRSTDCAKRPPAKIAAAKMDKVRFMAQPCAKHLLSSTEIQPSNRQFSAECRPPVPGRKAMLPRSESYGSGCAQFHTHAPQWTHFSRSNTGTPFSPGVMAWPLHSSMQIFVPHFSHNSG